MSNFNKYAFLEDLEDSLLQEIINENLTSEDEIMDFIFSELENQVIYYSDCFDISKALNLTSFEGFGLGDAKTINDLAYFGLYDFVNDEFDFSLINNGIENLENFDKWSFSDNCVNVANGKTKTQCTQYSKEFTYCELFKYYLKEYAN
jgi:hypothetical protein